MLSCAASNLPTEDSQHIPEKPFYHTEDIAFGEMGHTPRATYKSCDERKMMSPCRLTEIRAVLQLTGHMGGMGHTGHLRPILGAYITDVDMVSKQQCAREPKIVPGLPQTNITRVKSEDFCQECI